MRNLGRIAWPILESIIIAGIVGMMEESIAFAVIFLIGLITFTYLYGIIIRAIGWAVIGYLIGGEQSYFFANVFIALAIFAIRYVIGRFLKI